MQSTVGDILALAEDTRRALLRADELISILRRSRPETLRQIAMPLTQLHERLCEVLVELEDIEARLPRRRAGEQC